MFKIRSLRDFKTPKTPNALPHNWVWRTWNVHLILFRCKLMVITLYCQNWVVSNDFLSIGSPHWPLQRIFAKTCIYFTKPDIWRIWHDAPDSCESSGDTFKKSTTSYSELCAKNSEIILRRCFLIPSDRVNSKIGKEYCRKGQSLLAVLQYKTSIICTGCYFICRKSVRIGASGLALQSFRRAEQKKLM